MSNVCCSSPGGTISMTNDGGTVLIPTCAFASGWPSGPITEFGCTSSVNDCLWTSVRFGAELPSPPTIVVAVELTSCRIEVCKRGKYTPLIAAEAADLV